MGLFGGLFTFFVLKAKRMETLRVAFFFGLSVFVLTTLTANILYFGYRSFMQWVVDWPAGYYTVGAARSGVTPFPLPILMPSILLGKAEFIVNVSTWQTFVPTSFALFLFLMIPYAGTFLLFDRGFCGWICPLGGLPEIMSTAGKRRWYLKFFEKKPSETGGFSLTGLSGLKGWVEWMRYGILTGLIILSFAVPFSIINIISPALWVKSIPVFWTGIILIIVFAVVLPFMTKRRWWCDVICPVGATLALFHKISLFRIKIDKNKCNGCMDCVQECRMFAMTPQGVQRGEPASGNCIRCGRCIETCPEEAIDITLLGKNIKVRAPFLTMIIATVLAWYIWFVVLLVSYSTRLSEFQGL